MPTETTPSGKWSYSGDPGHSAVDAVRFLIGDTSPKEPLLTDGEIQYLLGQYNNAPLNTAVRCCETIMSKFSRMTDEKVGQVDIKFSQRKKQYTELLDTLRRRVAMEGAAPFCGGISRSQIQTEDSNSDRVRPDFTKHMMEDHQAGSFNGEGGGGRGSGGG